MQSGAFRGTPNCYFEHHRSEESSNRCDRHTPPHHRRARGAADDGSICTISRTRASATARLAPRARCSARCARSRARSSRASRRARSARRPHGIMHGGYSVRVRTVCVERLGKVVKVVSDDAWQQLPAPRVPILSRDARTLHVASTRDVQVRARDRRVRQAARRHARRGARSAR